MQNISDILESIYITEDIIKIKDTIRELNNAIPKLIIHLNTIQKNIVINACKQLNVFLSEKEIDKAINESTFKLLENNLDSDSETKNNLDSYSETKNNLNSDTEIENNLTNSDIEIDDDFDIDSMDLFSVFKIDDVSFIIPSQPMDGQAIYMYQNEIYINQDMMPDIFSELGPYKLVNKKGQINLIPINNCIEIHFNFKAIIYETRKDGNYNYWAAQYLPLANNNISYKAYNYAARLAENWFLINYPIE